VILLYSHTTAQEKEVQGGLGDNSKIKLKIFTPYKLMGAIDSSDMMLYTYLDERPTVLYWKKVTFNIIAKTVLSSYIPYKENYRDLANRNQETITMCPQLRAWGRICWC
jgi:hypothetical protein